MKNSSESPLQIVLLCSPSIGILDSWLPVISELSRHSHKYEISLFIPRFSILRQLLPSNLLVKRSSHIFSKLICIDSFGNMLVFRSFLCAYYYYYIALFDHSHLFFKRLLNYLASNHHFPSRQRRFPLPDPNMEGQVTHNDVFKNAILLYDVSEESKPVNAWFFKRFSFRHKFSLLHGIEIQSLPNTVQNPQIDSANLSCFLYSRFDIDYYCNILGIKKSCITVAGIPRHDQHWIQDLCKETLSSLVTRKSAILFSRPISDYLPKHRKVEALEVIKKCLVDEHNLFLYVKRHPKEKNEGLFESVLGSSLKHINWDYIDVHPYQVAQSCELALVFYSNLCVDMAALGIPTIEYLNLRNILPYSLPGYPQISSEPVFSYRFHGLVHGVSSEDQFRKAVSSIFVDKHAFVAPYLQQYHNYYPRKHNVSKYIASRLASVFDLDD